MFKNTKVSNAVRLAMVFGSVVAASSFSMTAAAADEEDSAKKVERIEVTGSRLKRTDVETASPVTTLGRVDIDSSGFQNIGDLLRNINQADVGGLTQLTNSTNGNDGSQTLSLRNLGAERSLVLVDGRRWLSLGGGQTDLSQIPLATIDRIEVLADGASAVYGSDAIAGVVNIITRRDYEGVEVDVTKGANFEGDGQFTTTGLTVGSKNAKTSSFLNVSATEQKPIMAGDREISRLPVFGVPLAAGSAFGEYGRFSVPNSVLGLAGTGNTFVALDPTKEGAGTRTVSDFEPFANKHRFNFAPQNYLLTPSKRLSIFGKMDHEFTENVRGFAQVTFNQRKSATQIASVPLTMFASGPQWNIPISAQNIYNPFGVEIRGAGFRTSPVGPRTYTQDYDVYFMTGGLEGDFELADRAFSWDVAVSRGEASRNVVGTNFINLQNLRNALGASFVDASGIARCGTSTNVIAGCVPLNLFNGVTGFTKPMQDYIKYTLVETTKIGNQDFTANISGDLVELPAGPLALALGVQVRNNTFSDTPDSTIAAGLSSSNFREPTNGAQKAEESYFEFAVPVVRDLPLVQALELSLAGRFSDFTNSGTVGTQFSATELDNESFKLGLTWRVNDELMLRGNFSDTFRAPSVGDLYSGGTEGFPAATDPCTSSLSNPFKNLTAEQKARCAAAGVPATGSLQATSQTRTLGGGNPFLKPEQGDTKTFGVVYNPEWLDGFDMTADVWEINLEDALASRGAQAIMNGCIRNGDPADCLFISRDAAGTIQSVRTSQFNLNKLTVSGVDASFNYSMDLGELGRLATRLNTTYTTEYKSTTGELSQAINQVGQPDSEIYRLRSNFSTTWTYEDYSVTWAVRHTSRLRETCGGYENYFGDGLATEQICNAPEWVNKAGEVEPSNFIGSTFYHDLSGSYSTPWDATVRVGVRNLFKKEPPRSLNAFANSFIQAYDIPGGQWFVQYTQKF
jgi:outer membrane receptor protein involved in Fe transport